MIARVLVSAYACRPNVGSEHGAGWAWTMAAAQSADIWLLTRQKNVAVIRAGIASFAPRREIRVVGVETARFFQWAKNGLPAGRYLYYLMWQRAARREAVRLHAQHAFTVAHHVTFACDWLPSGVVGIDGLPSIWGPVGGTLRTPLGVLGHIGLRHGVGMVFRDAVTMLLQSVFGRRMASRATVAVAQNAEVGRRLNRASGNTVIEPNAAIGHPSERWRGANVDGAKRAVIAGRLIPLKGTRIAIEVLKHAPDWTLEVLGTGPERSRLERRAMRLGVADRVVFRGNVDHDEVLRSLAHSDALLHTSFHDAGSWIVAEAAAIGCPIVCLDVGGPPEIARAAGGEIVPVSGPRLVERIAEALCRVRGGPTDRWSSARLPDLLGEWYRLCERGAL